MNFVQIEFPIFFGLVFACYWALGRRRWQNILLVVASAVFYGWVHPWFLLLLYGSAVFDFGLALAMRRWPGRRRLLLALSVTGNLGLLGYFKYFDFFVVNVAAALDALGIGGEPTTLGILLPVGISFYTFQTIGYAIDVARGEVEPRSSFVDYVLYVSFFPQLVAGPIERAGSLLPQIEAERRLTIDAARIGLTLALWGGFKKLVVADSLAPYVDKVFVLEAPAGPVLWAASAAFMVQIYADFSGYTDIARGTARLLGFELCENFNAPFLARTTVEFWQRWHMSLSTWIRDYLLGPLVGDSPTGVSRWRFAWATLVTFVLVGLWHGASWNFVLFGLYHGSWVVLYGVVVRVLPPRARALPGGSALAIGFHLVAVGLVGTMMFREHHLSRIARHLTTNPFVGSSDDWAAAVVLASVTALLSAPMVLGWGFDTYARPRVERTPWYLPLQTTSWAAQAAGMFLFYRESGQDFVYFQF